MQLSHPYAGVTTEIVDNRREGGGHDRGLDRREEHGQDEADQGPAATDEAGGEGGHGANIVTTEG